MKEIKIHSDERVSEVSQESIKKIVTYVNRKSNQEVKENKKEHLNNRS